MFHSSPHFLVDFHNCFCFEAAEKAENVQKTKMPELKRPLESADSTALVLAKKPRNELVEVTDKSKALVQSVSENSYWSFRRKIYHCQFYRDHRELPIWMRQLCFCQVTKAKSTRQSFIRKATF